MYTDKDAAGLISMLEMTPDEATQIQIALLYLLERDSHNAAAASIRRMAMIIDKVIS